VVVAYMYDATIPGSYSYPSPLPPHTLNLSLSLICTRTPPPYPPIHYTELNAVVFLADLCSNLGVETSSILKVALDGMDDLSVKWDQSSAVAVRAICDRGVDLFSQANPHSDAMGRALLEMFVRNIATPDAFEALLSIGVVPFDIEKLITGVLKHLNAHLNVFKANEEATEDDRKKNDAYFRLHVLPLMSALLSAVLRRSSDGIAAWIGYGKIRPTRVHQ
jgi:hypothetical protein